MPTGGAIDTALETIERCEALIKEANGLPASTDPSRRRETPLGNLPETSDGLVFYKQTLRDGADLTQANLNFIHGVLFAVEDALLGIVREGRAERDRRRHRWAEEDERRRAEDRRISRRQTWAVLGAIVALFAVGYAFEVFATYLPSPIDTIFSLALVALILLACRDKLQ